MALLGKVPYKNHGRRHVAGGSDPIPGIGVCCGPGTLLETLFVTSTTGTPVSSATVLEDGREYLLTVQGTYTLRNVALGDGTPEADAMFPTSTAGRVSLQVGWDPECKFADQTGGGGLGHQSNAFVIDLGGGFEHIEPDVGKQSTPVHGHLYSYHVTGEGSTVSFKIVDSVYTDNYGKLKVTIQAVGAGAAGEGEGTLVPDPTDEPDGEVLTTDSGVAVWATPSGGAPSGAAGGALDGTYPNPGIAASVAGNGLSESSNVLAVNVDGSTVEISSDSLRVKDAGITEAKLGLADNTTADVSTTMHGFVPKAPNDTNKFLRGDATWATFPGAGSADIGSGTSFPGSPSAGDLFYRTDRRIIYEYNSTISRWLTVDLKYFTLGAGGSLPGSGASPGDYGFLPLWEDVYIDSFVCSTFVATTNDGSKFWTVALRKYAAPNTATNVSSFTTASDTAGTWTVHNVSVATLLAASSYVGLNMLGTKTSTPGALYIGAAILVRAAG